MEPTDSDSCATAFSDGCIPTVSFFRCLAGALELAARDRDSAFRMHGRRVTWPLTSTVDDAGAAGVHQRRCLNGKVQMAFKVQNINVDLINATATLIAVDQADPQHPKIITAQFPFDPPHSEAREKDQAIAAAKAILQQAPNEI